jgi:hypothetical protein
VVTEHIEKSWKAYKRSFWTIIGAVLLVLIIPIVIILLALLPFRSAIAEAVAANSADPVLQVLGVGNVMFAGIFLLFGMIVSVVLHAGLVKLYAESLRRRASLKTVFSTAKEKFWTILGANALGMLISLIIFAAALGPGFLLLIATEYGFLSASLIAIGVVAAILVTLLFLFINQAVVIDNHPAVAAVKKSIRVVRANYLPVLILIIIFTAISILVSFVPYVSAPIDILLISPLYIISYTSLYLARRKKVK